jgi:capsular polysaccharide biosynthesis protein
MVSRMGSLSSLASLSGVNLSNGNSSATNEALERIKTYDFFLEHFLKNIKLEDLTAVKTWDEDNNKLIYDNELYDENLSEWQIKQISLKPTAQEAFIKYNEILTISQDKDNQFVRLSVEHFSPYIAKQWVDLIVNKIDESIREYDKKSAELSISYLNNSSNSTSFQSLKDSIASLLENQMQILMLASSNKSYVFKTLDSALIPEQKSSPNRVQILVLGTLLGFMMSISFILLSHFYMEYKKNITNNEGLK